VARGEGLAGGAAEGGADLAESRSVSGNVGGTVSGTAYDAVGGGARPWTPLALTLGLHLLLVLAWLGGARGDLRREPPPRVSVFVPVQPLSPPRRLVPEEAPAPERVRPPVLAAPALPSVGLSDIAVQAPAPPQSPDAGLANPPQEPAHNQAEQEGARSSPGDLLASSKAMAGRVDRELRKGASPITAEPERKWERFAEAFAAARAGAERTVTLDSYTSPDGVVTYRKTVGDRVACYRSGSVGGLVTGFGSADGQGAGSTNCPSGVRWTRH
jgi:hypothetical protein